MVRFCTDRYDSGYRDYSTWMRKVWYRKHVRWLPNLIVTELLRNGILRKMS